MILEKIFENNKDTKNFMDFLINNFGDLVMIDRNKSIEFIKKYFPKNLDDILFALDSN